MPIDPAAVQWDAIPSDKVDWDKPTKKKGTFGQGLVRQLLQGATFGGADELGSAVSAAISPLYLKMLGLPVNSTFSERYNQDMAKLKSDREAFKAENPKTALAAELTGGLATGGAAAAKLAGVKGISSLRTIPQLATIGGIEGATYGGLAADQGERLQGGAKGGLFGAVGAPVIQSAGRLAGHLARPVVSRAKNRLLGTPAGDARRYLATLLARDGIDSIDQIKPSVGRAQVNLADQSQAARGALEGIVSDASSQNVRSMAKKALEARNTGQQGRIFDAIDEGLNLPASATVKEAVDALKQSRSTIADPLYEEARKHPVKLTPYFMAMIGEKGSPEVRKAFTRAVNNTATKRAAGEQTSHITIIDELKKELDDTIGNLLQREGKKNRARDLITIKNKIVSEVDEQIPSYKQARDAWAGDTQLINAADEGKKILRGDVDYLDDLLASMGDSEKVMFRLGAKKAIREKLMAAREGTNSINRIASEINLERMRKAFPTEQAFNKFKQELKLEADIFDTSRVLHNSMTALRQSAQKDMSTTQGPLSDLGSDQVGIVAGAINRLFKSGLDEQAKAELGKILLTPLNELPKDLVDSVNRQIVRQLPSQQVGFYQQLLTAGSYAPTAAAATVPGIVEGNR